MVQKVNMVLLEQISRELHTEVRLGSKAWNALRLVDKAMCQLRDLNERISAAQESGPVNSASLEQAKLHAKAMGALICHLLTKVLLLSSQNFKVQDFTSSGVSPRHMEELVSRHLALGYQLGAATVPTPEQVIEAKAILLENWNAFQAFQKARGKREAAWGLPARAGAH